MLGYFRLSGLAIAAAMLSAAGGSADDNHAGRFDYYVLSLSWSPNWCARQGPANDAEQCDADADFGWLLHGLWPQHTRGYPENCATDRTDPIRAESDAMADIMGSGGLAWYQWKKHGRCSGLSGTDYYRLSRVAFEGVTRPPMLRALTEPVRLPATVVEDAFLEVNTGLSDDMITITCRDGMIQEARICLTRDLAPRVCGADVLRDCALTGARMEPIP